MGDRESTWIRIEITRKVERGQEKVRKVETGERPTRQNTIQQKLNGVFCPNISQLLKTSLNFSSPLKTSLNFFRVDDFNMFPIAEMLPCV